MFLIKKLMIKYQVFIRYSLIGATGASLDFLTYSILSLYIYYLLANAISVSIGITNNYFLNIFFNFDVKHDKFVRFLLFFSIGLFGLLVGSLVLFVLVDKLKMDKIISKLLTIIIVVTIQYTLNKRITFRIKY